MEATMVILDVKLHNIYNFNDFEINFSFPKKIRDSIVGDEFLEGRERFRYRKAIVLMGTNATGKTSLGRALLKICTFCNSGNPAELYDMVPDGKEGSFTIDLVNSGFVMHRVSCTILSVNREIEVHYGSCEIQKLDSYEKCSGRIRADEIISDYSMLIKKIGKLDYKFAYPEIETSLRTGGVDKKILLKVLKSVIKTLDPSFTEVVESKDLKDSFIIRRNGTEIVIQDGKILNRSVLSSGTAEGIDVAVFLAEIMSRMDGFYYCDEHFSFIQSDIEKRIFGIMMDHLGRDAQLIFTTHNTDMLDLNLPKHSFMFLRRDRQNHVDVISASDILKRNTDSVKCAVENDVFSSLPDDSSLDELEAGWQDE